jgi:acyl carrier protein
MTDQELFQVFRRIAEEVIEEPLAAIDIGSDIAVLGIDSLEMLEIVGSMERELQVVLPDDSLAGVVTVQNLIDLIRQQKAAA